MNRNYYTLIAWVSRAMGTCLVVVGTDDPLDSTGKLYNAIYSIVPTCNWYPVEGGGVSFYAIRGRDHIESHLGGFGLGLEDVITSMQLPSSDAWLYRVSK